MRLSRSVRVHVGDDDSSGLLFFGSIFRYVSEGEQQLFEALGHPAWAQIQEGTAAPVVHASCDFRAPARTGTELVQDIELVAGARSSMTFTHEFTSAASGELVAQARTVRCWVDLEHMVPQALPGWLSGAELTPSSIE